MFFITLISFIAHLEGVDPKVAVSLAQVESSLRPNVVGPVGEIGLFQVRPEYTSIPEHILRRPSANTYEGLRRLKYAKARCSHRSNMKYVICYNVGVRGGYRIEHPERSKYYLTFLKYYASNKVTIIPYRL